MPVNHYFQGGKGIGNHAEKRLYEDIVVESLKIYGHDCYYLPRTLVNRDLVLGEDVSSRFDHSYMVEMYMQTTEGFAGEQELVSKFGLEIRDDTTFCVAKRTWDYHVGNANNVITEQRPREGDIIYMPLMGSFFEILFVEDQEPFYQLGNLPVYKLRVTKWEYASEKLDTGVSAIDAAEDKYSLNELIYRFSLEIGTEESTGAGSILMEQDKPTGEPNFLTNEEFVEGEILQEQSPYADNLDLDTAGGFDTETVEDDILDFTESNPFGDIN
jgi:hypothetical protein